MFKAFAGMGDSFLCACGWVALDRIIITDAGPREQANGGLCKGKGSKRVHLGTIICVIVGCSCKDVCECYMSI